DDGGAAPCPLAGVRQGSHLGVRSSRPLVEALADDVAVADEDDAADDGVRAGAPQAPGGEHDGTVHRLGWCHLLAGHLPSPCSVHEPGGAKGVAARFSGDDGDRGAGPRCGTGTTGTVACCLPSGLSPSVLEFHQLGPPSRRTGSRTVTAGSDFHRPRSTRTTCSYAEQSTPARRRTLRWCGHTHRAGPLPPVSPWRAP